MSHAGLHLHMHMRFSHYFTCMSSVSMAQCNLSLFCFTCTKRLPLDMNGIMSRGISSSKHTAMSDITLGCLKDSIIETSFSSFFLSLAGRRSADWGNIGGPYMCIIANENTFASLHSNQLIAFSHVNISTIHQP